MSRLPTIAWLSVGLTAADERQAQRGEHADEWLRDIRETCLALVKQALPKSALGQAAAYTLNMWAELRRCFDYAEVELSSNLAENSMRPVALGKNWLHVGSAQAGPKVAAILSVVASCRRPGVPVKDYLAAVLPGLNRQTLSEVPHLTPARWSAASARSSPGFL
ncbi:MAG TPA: transposase [Bryobacteraceae bacterium]|nr:transposase [Bryobacteraceae bacterium]